MDLEDVIDVLLLLILTLIVLIVGNACLSFISKKSNDRTRNTLNSSSGSNAVGVGQIGASSTKSQSQSQIANHRPLSAGAQHLQRVLDLPTSLRGRFISMIATVGCIVESNPKYDHQLHSDANSNIEPYIFLPGAIDFLMSLIEFSDVFLFTKVKDSTDQQLLLSFLCNHPCTKSLIYDKEKFGPISNSNITSQDDVSTSKPLYALQRHRILFFSNSFGKIAMARQLSPYLFIDSEPETEGLESLVPYVQLLISCSSANLGLDQLKKENRPFISVESLREYTLSSVER